MQEVGAAGLTITAGCDKILEGGLQADLHQSGEEAQAGLQENECQLRKHSIWAEQAAYQVGPDQERKNSQTCLDCTRAQHIVAYLGE